MVILGNAVSVRQRERERDRERMCVCVCVGLSESEVAGEGDTFCTLGVKHSWSRRGQPEVHSKFPLIVERATFTQCHEALHRMNWVQIIGWKRKNKEQKLNRQPECRFWNTIPDTLNYKKKASITSLSYSVSARSPSEEAGSYKRLSFSEMSVSPAHCTVVWHAEEPGGHISRESFTPQPE